AERLSGLEVDHQLELCRLHDGKLGRPRTLQDSTCVDACLAIHPQDARSVTKPATGNRELARPRYNGQSISRGKRRKPVALAKKHRIAGDEHGTRALLSDGIEGRINLVGTFRMHEHCLPAQTPRGLL